MKKIEASFFSGNRQKLMEKVQGGLVVLSAYTKMQRSNDEAFVFTQESNFWYVTGIDQPNWWVIMDGQRGKSWLVRPTVSREAEIFHGEVSDEQVKTVSGINEIIDEDNARSLLRQLARTHSLVYSIGQLPYEDRLEFSLNPAPRELRDILERIFGRVQDCRQELAQLRAIKQPIEITAIKKAINITIKAFDKVKSELSDYRFEYEAEARFSYEFRMNGAGHAYDPIIASGKNACTLHYGANNSRLKKNQLILMDVGASYDGYPADITRTLAYGEPTARQREVHAAVKEAEVEIIKLCVAGTPVIDFQQRVDSVMERTLVTLGLMKLGDEESLRRYFPHAIGHGLGVDVHDSLGATTVLQSGMIMTIEPGIYIPEESIGVRIEDDILIGDKPINLSAKLSTDM